MKFLKTIETIVNLSPTEIYQDVDKVILDKLRASYQGRCESNCIIVDVREIVRRSRVRIEKASLKGEGVVNVCYRALVIQFKPGEILSNCEVQRVEQNNQFLCNHKHATVYIAGSRDMQVLKEGQRLSVVIDEVMHSKGMGRASVMGRIFEYPTTCTVFEITQDVSQADELVLNEWMEKLAAVEKKFKKSPITEHLVKAYYPFRGNPKIPKTWKTVPITEVPAPGTFVCRPPVFEKSQAAYILSDAADIPPEWNGAIQRERAGRALAEMVRDYYYFLVNLYKSSKRLDDKTLAEYSGLWMLYDNRKRD